MAGEPQPDPQREQSFEIGMDEAWKTNMKMLFDAWAANIKRTFDEYQELGLTAAKRSQTHFDKVISDAQQNDNARQLLANQALANAVNNENALAKQHLAHRDIATNKTWNLEPSEGAAEGVVMRSITLDDASLKAIGAAVAAAVASAINPPKPAPAA